MSPTARDFFEALYADAPTPERRLVVWVLEPAATAGGSRRQSRSTWTTGARQAASQARRLHNTWDVYFGVSLQDPAAALGEKNTSSLPFVRGTRDTAVLLPALFADLDVAAEAHKAGDLPPTGEDALALLDAVPHPPSIVVQSGHGYHVYWLLDPPFVFRGTEDRRRAENLLARVQGALARKAAEKGWKVDSMAELARVLRVPGTINHKLGERLPVTVLELHRDRRYAPSDFDVLPDPSPGGRARDAAPAGGPRDGQAGDPPHEKGSRHDLDRGPKADVARVRAGCAFFESCFADPAAKDYPSWFAWLNLLVRCDGHEGTAAELAHRYGRLHPGYSGGETEAKLREARKVPAYNCETVARKCGQPDYCSGCAHRALGSGPLTLGRPALLARMLRKARGEPPPAARDAVPVEIAVTPREDEVNDRALAAVAAREANLFERAGLLVQVVPSLAMEREDDDPAPVAQPVQEARLREILARHCDFRKRGLGKSGAPVLRPIHPPQWCVRALLHRGEWPAMRRLRGVVEGPVLRPDGSVLQTPGYDPSSGLYYAPGEEVAAVPEAPDGCRLADALGELNEAVCDFPFAGDEHHAAWLSALLTPLARYAFKGPAPLNLIDANVRGAGKSLLADVCATLLTGRPAERMSYTRDEDELRKSITALAIEGTPLALIDNIHGSFGSPTLDRALTGVTWRDRLLGGNVQVVANLRVVWFATGNNVTLHGDTPRRCLHVRLESPEERPEERSGFRHPRLLEWVARERHRLLPAALTLLRGYVAAGRPDVGLPAWGSYEGWSDLVRSTVVWLGLPDPAMTRGGLEEGAASEEDVFASLLEGIENVLAALGGEATALQILEQVRLQPGWYGPLIAALGELFPRLPPGELPTSAQLAYKLRALRGRTLCGRVLRPAGRRRGGTLWRVDRSSPDREED